MYDNQNIGNFLYNQNNMLHQVTKLNWLYFDFDSYFASVEQHLNIHLRNKPIAIVPLMTDSTCAIAASFEAKKFGIKTGTKIYEAKLLCKDLICVLARPSVYVEYHHLLLKEISKYLCIDYVFSIDEGACKLTGNQHDIDIAVSLAHQIKKALKDNIGEHITCSIGIAPNRYLAKIATSIVKPNGLTVIRPEDIPSKLFSLKVTNFPGIGRKVYERLRENNITSVQNLYALNVNQLYTAWGNIWGERCWYLLRGVDLPLEEVKRSTIGQSKVIGPEQQEEKAARNIMLSLILMATGRLRAKKLYTSRISLNLRTSSYAVYKKSIKVDVSNDSLYLSKIALESWDELVLLNKIKRIKKLAISLNDLSFESTQLSFFDNNDNQKGTRVSCALDHINGKFGKNAISVGLVKLKKKEETPIAFRYIPDKK